MLYLKINFYFL